MTDALIELKSGRVERYDIRDLPHFRKGIAGMGYSYLNSSTGRYEQARSIEVVPDELRERLVTRSAAVSARKSMRRQIPETIPTHIRLHKIYSL